MIDDNETDELSPRQQARRVRHAAGQDSARLAHALMILPQAQLDRLELEEELRDAVLRARAVTDHGPRRREERRLAGELRRTDMAALAVQVDGLEEEDHSATRLFQLAEVWRARLIAEDAGLAAFTAEHAGLDAEHWRRLINAARQERDSGRPRGAARALFRDVMTMLRRPG